MRQKTKTKIIKELEFIQREMAQANGALKYIISILKMSKPISADWVEKMADHNRGVLSEFYASSDTLYRRLSKALKEIDMDTWWRS